MDHKQDRAPQVPLFDDPTNFYVVIGAMILLAIGILGFARWRRWI